mgnify:CR=1 FL=1
MKSRYLVGTATVIASLVGLASSALATEGAQATADEVAEIVVTAQKREEKLQDVPVSIVALTPAMIERAGVKDLTDLRAQVPSLQITPHPNSGATARVFIRGVGNNDDQVTQDPSVAVYLDGIYMARSQGLAMEVAELERVEVLRGPQGSLYGRNATGGAINFITKAPTFGAWGADQRLTYGNLGQLRTRTRVNIPIGNRFAAELAYLHTTKDGFVANAGTGVSRFGDQRRDGYRAALRWQPLPQLDVRYTYDRSDVNDTPVFISTAPFYPAEALRPVSGSPSVKDLKPNHIVAQGHGINANLELGDYLTLRSITGFRQLANQTNQNYLSGVLGAFPVFATTFDSRQRQFSEELQLVGSSPDKALQYVLGLYLFSESAESYDTTASPGRPRSDRNVTIANKALALYGEATWSPEFANGHLHLTAGGRWSRDHRQATLQNVSVPANGSSIFSTPGAGDRVFHNFSPSGVIRYDLSTEANLYAKVTSGYKTGGYNVRASTIQRFNQGFGQETLVAYELGLKTTLLDRHLRFNAAVFQSNYKNIQINVQSDPTNISRTDVLNAGKARIRGAELDLSAVPIDGLTINLSYALLDAKYQQILDGNGAEVTANYNYIQAPKNTLTAGIEYVHPLEKLGNFSASLDYSYQDRKNSSSTDFRYIVGAYGLLNARIGLSSIPLGASEWSLNAFGRNLTDKSYYLDQFNAGLPAAIFGEPRTYGIELGVKF